MLTFLTSIQIADKGIPGGGHQYVKYTEWRLFKFFYVTLAESSATSRRILDD